MLASPGTVYATDVVIETPLPENIRDEWTRKRDFQCTCGFLPGKHPFCNACGLAIGPEHIQRRGGSAVIAIWADTLDPSDGIWKVVRREEPRIVCGSCFLRWQSGQLQIQPVRQTVRMRKRLSTMNAWRRKHGLPTLAEHAPAFLI